MVLEKTNNIKMKCRCHKLGFILYLIKITVKTKDVLLCFIPSGNHTFVFVEQYPSLCTFKIAMYSSNMCYYTISWIFLSGSHPCSSLPYLLILYMYRYVRL